MAQLVAATDLKEIDGGQMMSARTAFADRLARGEAVNVDDQAMIHHHLEICPECREESEMIRGIADEGNLSSSKFC